MAFFDQQMKEVGRQNRPCGNRFGGNGLNSKDRIQEMNPAFFFTRLTTFAGY
ncbi:hypothetical protein [Neobacillus soli]|uniref:hypothetical protein n=1 Tax=Neobacillus soli TaxID=220688 RepID=UPI000AF26911|nr:hypothetical protein [Neobacillus soli]